jgi:hypothetical protein
VEYLIRATTIAVLALLPCKAFATEVAPQVGERCPPDTYEIAGDCKTLGSENTREVKSVSKPEDQQCPLGSYRANTGDCQAFKSSQGNQAVERAMSPCPPGWKREGGFCKR